MKVELLTAVRLYGLDVLILGLIARLLRGLSKRLSMASTDIFDLVARKKDAKAEKAASRLKE